MAGNKYIAQSSGLLTEVAAIQTSAGAGDAGKIPAVDSTGRLDATLMPVGVVPEVKSLVTSENLTAGNMVNVYNNAGTPTARNADNTNGRVAHGFVLAGTTSPAAASVYLEGIITGLSALTAGTQMFLGVAGAATATAPSTSGYIVQQIGVPVSATEIAFNPQQTITLA